MTLQTLIVGGGLSGLALAQELQQLGADYCVIEARSRWGGRILTEHHGAAGFDLGPAWFWPGQPRIARLVTDYGLGRFEQHYAGAQLFEDVHGQIHKGQGFASMQGSWRLDGGLSTLTEALAATIPPARKRLRAEVTRLVRTASGVEAHMRDGTRMTADRVVLAMPPRLAADITFSPALPLDLRSGMQDVATWMAGQAKAVALYDTPFWREAGLSGDASSRRGPLVEIHDASPEGDGPYALFGFLGVPPATNRDEDPMRGLITEQLGRLFGQDAQTPLRIWVKDWAHDPLTAVAADHAPLFSHPAYGPPPAGKGAWDQHVYFSGTETAPQFGGYLEGALEAAERTLRELEAH